LPRSIRATRSDRCLTSLLTTLISFANAFPDEIVRLVGPYLSDWPHHKPLR
jgi:hypothetical protein